MSETFKPWRVLRQRENLDYLEISDEDGLVQIAQVGGSKRVERSALIAAAPELLLAAELLEKAETANANCEECDGEGAPELCHACFPLFDDARVLRRLAIAKARGATAVASHHSAPIENTGE